MLSLHWFGFIAGGAFGANESAVIAFAATNSPSATAMLTWGVFDLVRGKKISTLGVCIGSVVGLVAVTPAAGFITIPQSLALGILASIISRLAVHWKTQTCINDTFDIFSC